MIAPARDDVARRRAETPWCAAVDAVRAAAEQDAHPLCLPEAGVPGHRLGPLPRTWGRANGFMARRYSPRRNRTRPAREIGA